MILTWTRPAESDLIEILDYNAEDDPTAALATIDRIEAVALRLTDTEVAAVARPSHV